MKTSARNQFVGTVTSLRSGAVNDEVEITAAQRRAHRRGGDARERAVARIAHQDDRHRAGQGVVDRGCHRTSKAPRCRRAINSPAR